MKAIIWGANGQDGYYLSRLLLSEGVELIQISRSGNFLQLDISDWKQVSELIRLQQPDYIFHLAAQSTTQHVAWEHNHQTISTGSLYLLEAVRLYSPHTRVFLSGSGLQFKNEGNPIKESDPFAAKSIYAVSRIHTVYAARYYRELGLKIYVGYLFNHDSPLRSDKHVSRKVTDAVKRIAGGQAEKIRIGDLSTKKEWGFAGDIVKAIWIFVQQDFIFEATIGTGLAYSIGDWIDICFNHAHIDPTSYVEEEKGFQAEYGILVSDPSTIFSLGWRPEISVNALSQMMIDQV
jgi:GDPmannose 4,6-dehydratase